MFLLSAIPSELSKHESIKITFPPIRVPKRRVVVVCMNGFVEEPDDRWVRARKAGSVRGRIVRNLLIKSVSLCPSVLVSKKMKGHDAFYEQRVSMTCCRDNSLGPIGRRRRAGIVVAFVMLDNSVGARSSHL